MFKKEIFIKRRRQLVKDLKKGVLLFLGNEESPMNYTDNPYHFRQDSSFIYFFGINCPGLAAIIDLESGREIIFGDDLSVEMIVWMGAQPTLKEKCDGVGITQIKPVKDLFNYINSVKQTKRMIHFLPPYRPENKIKLMNLLGINPSVVKEKASLDFIKAVIKQRNIKSKEEIEEINKAVDLTTDMHVSAMKLVKSGRTEAEIAAEVHKVALAAGGNISFPIIATVNGQTLHNHYHGNTLKDGDLFLLDAGGETENLYAGDLSSTMPVSKTFTSLQKEIYEITLNAHETAIKLLKPGIKFLDIHIQACRTIAEGMKGLGMMKGDLNEAVKIGAHALFFPCGLGHMMGLDIHDMEDLGEQYVGYSEDLKKSTVFGYKSLRLARELKPGFVLTIEPGIYFIPELIDLWKSQKKFEEFIDYNEVEKYKNFGGIRNEEDFVITDNGTRMLGKQKPKTIDEVENLRK